MITVISSLLEQAESLLTSHGFKFRSAEAPGATGICFYGPTRLLDLAAAERLLTDTFGDVLCTVIGGSYEDA